MLPLNYNNAASRNVRLLPQLESKLWSIDEIRQAMADPEFAVSHDRPIPPNFRYLEFSATAHLFFGSTQPRKMHETRAPLQAMARNAELKSAIGPLHYWFAAPEISKSYIGNGGEKINEIINRIEMRGMDEVRNELIRQGYDPNNTVFVVNDSGLTMNTNYANEPEFVDGRHKLEGDCFPGHQLGPFTEAMGGILGAQTAWRKLYERKRANGEDIDLTGWDETTVFVMRFGADVHKPTIMSFEARVPVVMVPDIDPPSDTHLVSQHFFKPAAADLTPEQRSKTLEEQKSDFLSNIGPTAQAMWFFMNHTDIEQTPSLAFKKSAQKSRQYRVATQESLLKGSLGHETKIPKGLNHLKRKEVETDIEQADAFDTLADRADAILLGTHSKTVIENWDNYFLEMFDMFSSLVVAKQVYVEQFYEKPFFILAKKGNGFNSNGDLDWTDPKTLEAFVNYMKEMSKPENLATDPWRIFIEFTKYLHETGYIKQEPQHLFETIDIDEFKADPAAIRKKIKDRIKETIPERVPVPAYETEVYQKGPPPSGRPSLFIAGSAGTYKTKHRELAENLAEFWAHKAGILRTGGGEEGIMGAAGKKFISAVSPAKGLVKSGAWLDLVQMPRTIQFEGATVRPEAAKKSDFIGLEIARSFGARINRLISDVNVIIAPGIGSYQELVRLLRKKNLKNPIILANLNETGSSIGVFDPFLAILPPIHHNKIESANHGTDVIKRVEKQMQVLQASRRQEPVNDEYKSRARVCRRRSAGFNGPR